MNEPTILVSMETQNPASKVGIMPSTQEIQFELGKDSLGIMLEGLRKIREQLKKL